MAKNKGSTVETVTSIVLPVCEEMGLKLWDVTFEKEGAEWFLKVLVEKEGADIDILECEAFSRRIDPLIDEADPIDQSYFLEVGSPGLGRRLNKEEHFKRYLGEIIYVRLIRPDENGVKEIKGKLLEYKGSTIEVEGFGDIELNKTSFVKLCDNDCC